MSSTLDLICDPLAGQYLVEVLDHRYLPLVFEDEADLREFSPNALRYFVR